MATLRPLVARLREDPATTEVIVVADRCRIDVDVLTGGRGGTEVRVVHVSHGSAAASRHDGVRAARHDVVLLLDDDVVPDRDLVSGHAARHRDGADRLVVVGVMETEVPPRGDPSHVPATMYAQSYDVHRRAYERDPDSILRSLWGGNYSLRRALALEVGLHDPDYPTVHHNDRDFGLRLHKAGAVAVFDPALRVQHRYVRPPKWVWADARRQGAGRAQLLRRHADVLSAAELIPTDRHVSVRPLVWLVRSRAGDRQARRFLGLATRIARRLRAWRLERWIVHRMRTAEVIAGAATEQAQLEGSANREPAA